MDRHDRCAGYYEPTQHTLVSRIAKPYHRLVWKSVSLGNSKHASLCSGPPSTTA